MTLWTSVSHFSKHLQLVYQSILLLHLFRFRRFDKQNAICRSNVPRLRGPLPSISRVSLCPALHQCNVVRLRNLNYVACKCHKFNEGTLVKVRLIKTTFTFPVLKISLSSRKRRSFSHSEFRTMTIKIHGMPLRTTSARNICIKSTQKLATTWATFPTLSDVYHSGRLTIHECISARGSD